MKKEERFEWIRSYLKALGRHGAVDILDRDFVESYQSATGAKVDYMIYGAPKCNQLGRDLAEMAKKYYLKRERVGLNGMGGMGFPRWVFSYSLYAFEYGDS